MMRRRHRSKFRYTYFTICGALLILAIAAILYVRCLLIDYEAAQPEACARAALAEYSSAAEKGALWDSIDLPDEPTLGKFEADKDIKAEYSAFFASDSIDIVQKAEAHDEDEMIYSVRSDGFVFAEIRLRAVGESVTKLAVFTSREWKFDSLELIVEKKDYTLSLPKSLNVSLNGIALGEADAVKASDGGLEYTIKGLYLPPSVDITDVDGNTAEYTIKGTRIVPVIFNYSLTLPTSLTVTVNGAVDSGELLDDGLIRHDIRLLVKPEVVISDLFGNSTSYEGGDELPLTYIVIKSNGELDAKVNGASIPAEAVSVTDNPDFATFSEFDPTLPGLYVYDIAILKDDALITACDEAGVNVDIDPSLHYLDLTKVNGTSEIPAEISSEIDVLAVAEAWSLFMSNDKPFYEISRYLIPSSYQYTVGTKYANGIDITFTSIHTLDNPPFTDETVGNYVQITENCFSVDISFEKHMTLSDGNRITDSMNDRFYFVRYENSWKLVCMMEIVD